MWTRVVAWCLIVVLGLPLAASADSLSEGIEQLFGERGITLDQDRSGLQHRAHFTSESLATFSLLAKQLAANAADFPAIGTSAGFTYKYSPKLEIFEPATANLGPVFLERAQTVGQGKVLLGFSYLFVDFEELNGENLDDLQFLGLAHNDCCAPGNPPPSPDNPAFEVDTADLRFRKLDLQSHVFFVSGTYGLSDWWDVNLLLPIVHTSLDVSGEATLNDESGSDTHFFDVNTGRRIERRSFDDEKTGVGDLLLRTKARVVERDSSLAAGGLTLRIPAGDEDDFQGLGDVTVTPFVTGSHEFGPIEVHGNGGIEVNFDDADRSRVRYAGGIAYQLVDRVALNVDVVGSSNLVVDRIGVTVPQFVNAPGTSEADPTTLPTRQRFTKNVFTNIIDVAPGVKAALTDSMVGYVTFFVPITDAGLRAEFIPAAGIQGTF